MAKLWILSDLHMETMPYPEMFDPARPDFDVLVVAGDVWQGDYHRAFVFAKRLARGKPVVFVLGNHEHWEGVLQDDLELAKAVANVVGVTLLASSEAEIAGVRFVGTTLWADGLKAGVESGPRAETGEQIDVDHGSGTHLITVGDAARLHAQARADLERLLQAPSDGRPVVVVTHHAPHPLCMPEAFRGQWAEGISASDLSHLTDAGTAVLWIHGHIHENVDLVRPGGTRILCNPAGPMFSNPGFRDDLVVEV